MTCRVSHASYWCEEEDQGEGGGGQNWVRVKGDGRAKLMGQDIMEVHMRSMKLKRKCNMIQAK